MAPWNAGGFERRGPPPLEGENMPRFDALGFEEFVLAIFLVANLIESLRFQGAVDWTPRFYSIPVTLDQLR